jgi:glycosyltransferase involved in cell wall biosynthesis
MTETLTAERPLFELESKVLAKITQEILREEVTVVIPALNEEKGISLVIEKTLKAGFSDIIVVDGGSTDKTVELASQMAVRVVTQHGKGKTDALDTAVGFVETPYLALIDADDTYDPNDINTMLEHISNADQVIGSRVLGGNNENNSQTRFLARWHGFGNRLLNFTFNNLFSAHLTDVLSGIRLFRVESLKQIHFESVGFGAEAEVTAQYLMDGRKVIETPVHLKERLGNPKLRYRDGFHILTTILRLAYEYNPLIYFIPLGVIFMLPGLALLGYVGYEAYITVGSVFHSGYALLGLGLFLTGFQAFSLGMVSYIMKRSEFRQLRAMRRSST